MRLRLPTSSEGTSRFAIEIAIVVIGVLIALGAQHIVTGWNDQKQADAALAAVRKELAVNAGTFEERTLQQPCIERRLADMSRILSEARRTGRLPDLEKVGRSVARPTLRNAWEEAAQSGAVHRWPERHRIEIASIYSQQLTSDPRTAEEATLWKRLSASEMSPGAVSPADLTLLSEILGHLRSSVWNNGLDASQQLQYISALGIVPSYYMIFDVEGRKRAEVVDRVTRSAICQPLVATPVKAA